MSENIGKIPGTNLKHDAVSKIDRFRSERSDLESTEMHRRALYRDDAQPTTQRWDAVIMCEVWCEYWETCEGHLFTWSEQRQMLLRSSQSTEQSNLGRH